MKDKENEKLDNSLKLLAKSSFIVFIGIFASKLLAYLYRIVIARSPQFGPETYGLFSLAVIIISMIISIFSLGLPGGLLRYISLYRGKKEINKISFLIKYSLIITVISSIIAMILLFLFSDYISIKLFHDSSLSHYLKWFSITIPISLILGVYIVVIQAYEKINWYSFIRNILDNIVKIIVLVVLIYFGLKINAIIFSYIFGVIAMLIASYYLCRYKLPEVFKKYSLNSDEKKKITFDVLNYSWPLILSGIVYFFFTSIDSFVIGYFMDVKWVGIYNAAIPIAALLTIVPTLFIQLFFPLITKEFAKNNHQLIAETSKQVGKWIFLLNLPVLIIMILFPGAIINLLFGPDYLSAAQSLRFLSIGTFFFSIALISENLLSMAGKSRIVLYNLFMTAIINLILDIALIGPFGIDGVAFSTLVVYSMWGLVTLIQARKYTSVVPLKRKMLLITLISLIPTIILLLLRSIIPINIITLILLGILFLLLYGFLIIITKCLDKNDLMIIDTIKKKLGPINLLNGFSSKKDI